MHKKENIRSIDGLCRNFLRRDPSIDRGEYEILAITMGASIKLFQNPGVSDENKRRGLNGLGYTSVDDLIRDYLGAVEFYNELHSINPIPEVERFIKSPPFLNE